MHVNVTTHMHPRRDTNKKGRVCVFLYTHPQVQKHTNTWTLLLYRRGGIWQSVFLLGYVPVGPPCFFPIHWNVPSFLKVVISPSLQEWQWVFKCPMQSLHCRWRYFGSGMLLIWVGFLFHGTKFNGRSFEKIVLQLSLRHDVQVPDASGVFTPRLGTFEFKN